MTNLKEGFDHKDLETLVKPTLHIDEFASKMGDDDDIVVVSFYIRDHQAGKDLVSFFETGYPYILDAELSDGEIKPNRFLIYIELKRRTAVPDQLCEILKDLSSLTEYTESDWRIYYKQKYYKFTPEIIRKIVPLSPHSYRLAEENSLNEMRSIAGLAIPTKPVDDPALVAIQRAANIK